MSEVKPIKVRSVNKGDTETVYFWYRVGTTKQQIESTGALDSTRCRHSYDCCGRWYRTCHLQTSRTGRPLVVQRWYQNV